jgi:hypothetical protein
MGQMRCQCEACGVLVGAPFPAIGNADTALDNALQAGRCIP